jgi:hypothetical protein
MMPRPDDKGGNVEAKQAVVTAIPAQAEHRPIHLVMLVVRRS